MKHVSLLCLIGVLVFAAGCRPAASDEPHPEFDLFGEDVPVTTVRSAADVVSAANQPSGETVAVEGVVREVCQKSGCWIILETPDDAVLRVHVAQDDDGEYGFTLPQDIAGRTAVVVGELTKKELSAEQQSHYAEESDGAVAAQEFRIDARSVRIEHVGRSDA